MKKCFLGMLLLVSLYGHAQLTVNIMLPPGGAIDKQQLWNIVATNTEPVPLNVQAQVSFYEAVSGRPVFTATTSPFNLSTGTSQLSATTMGVIQYNAVNPDYRIDPGPTGLLPVGTFNVCYDFIISKPSKVVQECQTVIIPTLAPLLLSTPVNKSVIEEQQLYFSWIPPAMVNNLNNVRFELKLVEVLQNQSAADAIQLNIPVFTDRNILSTNLQYNPGAPSLASGKEYAWKICLLNGASEVAQSEVWSFSMKQQTQNGLLRKPEAAYIKLRKAGMDEGFHVFWSHIRFDYFNESADTSWNIQVQDLTTSQHTSFELYPDRIKLKRGQNLVSYDGSSDNRFVDKHQYLIKVTGANHEVWQLRFEYRKPE